MPQSSGCTAPLTRLPAQYCHSHSPVREHTSHLISVLFRLYLAQPHCSPAHATPFRSRHNPYSLTIPLSEWRLDGAHVRSTIDECVRVRVRVPVH